MSEDLYIYDDVKHLITSFIPINQDKHEKVLDNIKHIGAIYYLTYMLYDDDDSNIHDLFIIYPKHVLTLIRLIRTCIDEDEDSVLTIINEDLYDRVHLDDDYDHNTHGLSYDTFETLQCICLKSNYLEPNEDMYYTAPYEDMYEDMYVNIFDEADEECDEELDEELDE
jgi:hypothetical protein